MNFSKKNHTLVGQNENGVKKPHKHDANLQKNTTLYFQVGLILCLLASYALLEMQFQSPNPSINDSILFEDDLVYVEAPVFKTEEIKQELKPEPVQKKKLANSFEEVPDDTTVKDAQEDIITEPEPNNGPELNPDNIDVIDIPEDDPVHINHIQRAPIYPGCEKFSKETKRRKCLSNQIGKLVSRKFNQDIISESGLTGKQRINVQFKIDKTGQVTDIKARALSSRLQKEAIKVINRLPVMIPGRQNDKNVDVIYTLPITLQAQH